MINGREIEALIDTGSDISLIRAEEYVKLGSPCLSTSEIRFCGIGSSDNTTLGEFQTEIIVDKNTYPIIIHVVSDILLQL